MAVTSVTELMEREGSWERNWKRSYTRKFRVQTDTPDTDQVDVLYARDPSTGVKIPALGQIYTAKNGNFDGGSFCEQVQCSNEAEDGKSWIVTVQYGPYDPTQFDAQNPLDAPPKVRFGLSRQSITADKDVDGKPVVNSAGQAFDPPIEKDESRLVMSVEVNVQTFDANLFAAYKDTVNDDVWWIFAPKTVKFMNATAELQHSGDCPVNGGLYWVMTWEFEIKEDTWTKKILDQGLMCIGVSGGSSGELIHCIDTEGQPASEPMLLDGAGHQNPKGAGPVYLSYDVYEPKDFSVFNLTQRGPY